jgi:nicotinamidase-related amidase
MTVDLTDIAAPQHTAIVTQELQGAVVGPSAGLGALAANHNAPIFAMGTKQVDISPGSEGAALLPEFGPAPDDVELHRWHGVGPTGGADLDSVLRNLGVATIVAVGVSVNIAITNVVMDAVNKGYRVVVPRDAVTGIPADYADAIIDNTISLLATVTHRRAAGDGQVHVGDAQVAGHRGVHRTRRRTVDRRCAAHRGDGDGTVLSEANGLMIKLLPHQPWKALKGFDV